MGRRIWLSESVSSQNFVATPLSPAGSGDMRASPAQGARAISGQALAPRSLV